MRTLNFEQMEQVNGGKDDVGCGFSLAGIASGVVGILAFGLAVGSGPIGWATMLGFGATMFGTGVSGASAVMTCL